LFESVEAGSGSAWLEDNVEFFARAPRQVEHFRNLDPRIADLYVQPQVEEWDRREPHPSRPFASLAPLHETEELQPPNFFGGHTSNRVADLD
jgi:hypothetical protein